MSIGLDIEVRCVKCRQVGPDVGDGGFLGSPSLELDEDGPLGPTFWYYYEPLREIGLRPFELERFNDWLLIHARHPVFPVGDIPDPMGVPARVLYWDDQKLDRGYETEYAGPTPDDYVWARYELSCVTCRVSCAADEPEWVFRTNELVLTDEAPRFFLERWGDPEDVVALGLSPLADPHGEFMESLREFLDAHRYRPRRGLRPASSHTLQVHLMPAPPPDDATGERGAA